MAGVSDKVGFETKVAMAKVMVRRAIADQVPFRWVTADAAYGFSKGWRFELEEADVFHVMAVPRHDTVVTRWIDRPVHDLFTGLPRQKRKRRGKGGHGQRIYDWARVEVRPWHRPDRRHWVLARRSVSRPGEISYYIAYCPADITLNAMSTPTRVVVGGGPGTIMSHPGYQSGGDSSDGYQPGLQALAGVRT